MDYTFIVICLLNGLSLLLMRQSLTSKKMGNKTDRFFKSELHITFRMFPSDPTGSLDAFS